MNIFSKLHWGTRNEDELVRRDNGSQSYYVMLILATILSTLGVLSNNATVIIGAMLIAPLMVPLSSLSVAIAHGDTKRMIDSLSHVSMSIFIIILISFVFAKIIPTVGISEEALARARPNFIDLLIALAAGGAGMYAYLHKDVPESLAGVGIAVALLIPLSVVGVGLSAFNWALSVGATVLFFTNMVAIISANVFVLFVHGRFTRQKGEQKIAVAGWGLTVSLIVVLSVLLGGVFLNTYQEEQIKERVKQTLIQEFKQRSDVEMQTFTVNATTSEVKIEVIIRLPEEAEAPSVDVLSDALLKELDRSVKLELSLLRIESATKL